VSNRIKTMWPRMRAPIKQHNCFNFALTPPVEAQILKGNQKRRQCFYVSFALARTHLPRYFIIWNFDANQLTNWSKKFGFLIYYSFIHYFGIWPYIWRQGCHLLTIATLSSWALQIVLLHPIHLICLIALPPPKSPSKLGRLGNSLLTPKTSDTNLAM